MKRLRWNIHFLIKNYKFHTQIRIQDNLVKKFFRPKGIKNILSSLETQTLPFHFHKNIIESHFHFHFALIRLDKYAKLQFHFY